MTQTAINDGDVVTLKDCYVDSPSFGQLTVVIVPPPKVEPHDCVKLLVINNSFGWKNCSHVVVTTPFELYRPLITDVRVLSKTPADS